MPGKISNVTFRQLIEGIVVAGFVSAIDIPEVRELSTVSVDPNHKISLANSLLEFSANERVAG